LLPTVFANLPLDSPSGLFFFPTRFPWPGSPSTVPAGNQLSVILSPQVVNMCFPKHLLWLKDREQGATIPGRLGDFRMHSLPIFLFLGPIQNHGPPSIPPPLPLNTPIVFLIFLADFLVPQPGPWVFLRVPRQCASFSNVERWFFVDQ